jgi:hypothetical protein
LCSRYRDPWAFSENCFIAARGKTLVLLVGQSHEQVIYELSEADRNAGLECHEPRPLNPRPREQQISSRIRAMKPWAG